MADYLFSQCKKVAEPAIGFTWANAENEGRKGNPLWDLKISHPFFGSTIWKVSVSECSTKWTGTVRISDALWGDLLAVSFWESQSSYSYHVDWKMERGWKLKK